MQAHGKMPFPGRTGCALALALMIAGCGKAPQEEASASAEGAIVAEAAPMADAAAAEAGAAAVTGADPAVAPGVAFTYDFSFRLADDKVSAAQDAHVSACARLGTARCRVVGLSYEQEKDGPVTGRSSFLVDPSLARGFARDAVDAVARLDGDLLESRVGGEDVGTDITQSQRQSARLGGDVARLEERLRQPGLSPRERAELQRQVGQLRDAMNGEEQAREQGEARLASTPVQFSYRGATGLTGIDSDRPFASALSASLGSLKSASAVVLTLLGIALPWLLLVGAVVLGIRLVTRRRKAASTES